MADSVMLPLSLSDFVTKLIDETASAVLASQRQQSSRLDELAQLVALPPPEFAEKFVAASDAAAQLEQELGISGPKTKVDTRRIAELYGVKLEPKLHYEPLEESIGILHPEGYRLLLSAVRARLADGKQAELEQVLRQGVPRVLVDSGEIRAKVRLNTSAPAGTTRLSPSLSDSLLSKLSIQVETVPKSAASDAAASAYSEVILRFRTVF